MLKNSLAVVFVLTIAVAGTHAQRGNRGGAPPDGAGGGGQRGGRGGGEGAAPAAKPYVPTSATALARDPNPFIGENVTLTAAVEQILSHSAFLVEQRLPAGSNGSPKAPSGTIKDVLVLAPILNAPVDQDKYVTVAGEVMKFDPAEIAKKVKNYQLDLTPDAAEKYKGRPVIIAKVVVNGSMVDLAMRLPPPYTADEKSLDDTMKKVAPASAALRASVDASRMENTADNIVLLKKAFTEAEAFWKGKAVADAVKKAQDARTLVETIDREVASGDWDNAKKSVASLNQACGGCHTPYRERFDDGSFRARLPEKAPGSPTLDARRRRE
jgi:cytochrome c556